MNLGLLGGTFDPPHFGHLHIARGWPAIQLQLDEVLFVPAGVQPLKQGQIISAPEQRARLSNSPSPISLVSRCRGSISIGPGRITQSNSVRLGSSTDPAAAVWFIMGEDSLSDRPRWREPQRLITLARLAVLRRPNTEPDWFTLDAALPDLRARLIGSITPRSTSRPARSGSASKMGLPSQS